MKTKIFLALLLTCSITWAQKSTLPKKAELISRALNKLEIDLSTEETRTISFHLIEVAIILGIDLDSNHSSASLFCKHTNGSFYRLADANTGVELDKTGTSLESCNKRKYQQMGVFCRHTSNSFYRLTSINGFEYDKNGTNLEECLSRIPANGSKLVCKHTSNNYFRVTNIEGKEFDSSGSSLMSCLSRI